MQGDFARREMANRRKHMNLEGAQDFVVPLFVPLAVRRIPLTEEGFHGIGLQDCLLLQLPDDPGVMPLLQLGAKTLRFRACVFQGHQGIGAEVKAAGPTVVAEAQLEGDLAFGGDAHTQAVAVSPLFTCVTGLAAVGLQPGIRDRHGPSGCAYIIF
ncbi:hypothetical protein D3C79_844110 [compost metagenome]